MYLVLMLAVRFDVLTTNVSIDVLTYLSNFYTECANKYKENIANLRLSSYWIRNLQNFSNI